MSNEPDHITYQKHAYLSFSVPLTFRALPRAGIVYSSCVKCENVGYKYAWLTSVVVICDHGNLYAMYRIHGKLRWPQSSAVVFCFGFFFNL